MAKLSELNKEIGRIKEAGKKIWYNGNTPKENSSPSIQYNQNKMRRVSLFSNKILPQDMQNGHKKQEEFKANSMFKNPSIYHLLHTKMKKRKFLKFSAHALAAAAVGVHVFESFNPGVREIFETMFEPIYCPAEYRTIKLTEKDIPPRGLRKPKPEDEQSVNKLKVVAIGDSRMLGQTDGEMRNENDYRSPVKYFFEGLKAKLKKSKKIPDIQYFNLAEKGVPIEGIYEQMQYFFSDEFMDENIKGGYNAIQGKYSGIAIEDGGGNNILELFAKPQTASMILNFIHNPNPYSWDLLEVINFADSVVGNMDNTQYKVLKDQDEENKGNGGFFENIIIYGMPPLQFAKGIVRMLTVRQADVDLQDNQSPPPSPVGEPIAEMASGYTVDYLPDHQAIKFLAKMLSLAYERRQRMGINMFEALHPDASFTLHYQSSYDILAENYTKEHPTILYEHDTTFGYKLEAAETLSNVELDKKPIELASRRKMLNPKNIVHALLNAA